MSDAPASGEQPPEQPANNQQPQSTNQHRSQRQQEPSDYAAANYAIDDPVREPAQYIGEDNIDNTLQTVTLRDQDGPKYMNKAIYELENDVAIEWVQYPNTDVEKDAEDRAPATTDSLTYAIELEISGHTREDVDAIDDHIYEELSDRLVEPEYDRMFK